MQLEEARVMTSTGLYSWNCLELKSIQSIHVSTYQIPSLTNFHWWSIIQSSSCEILQLGTQTKSWPCHTALVMQINNSNFSV